MTTNEFKALDYEDLMPLNAIHGMGALGFTEAAGEVAGKIKKMYRDVLLAKEAKLKGRKDDGTLSGNGDNR